VRRTFLLGIIPLLLSAPSRGDAQSPTSGRVGVGDASLEYLDFGGEGVAIVFIHAADRGANTWRDFAPAFTDRHRVLAITARGVAGSTGAPGSTAARVADLLAVMDSVGLRQAVFIGNSSPAMDMTYLAEHYPERVAGLVYLANAPPVAGLEASDPTGAFGYALRATNPPNPFPYRPEYLNDTARRIAVPALTFVGQSGTRGMELRPFPLLAARMLAERGGARIADSAARTFLERLASDDELQAEVARAWREHVAPAIVANEQAFRRAFGSSLQVVQLSVPLVSGYEYRDRPGLILAHIRAFLDGLPR